MNHAVRVSLDESGRIVIPPSLRKQLRLEPGMTLVVEEEEGGVCLRVQAEPTTLVEKDGLLVARVAAVGDLSDVTRRERDYRVSDLSQRAGL